MNQRIIGDAEVIRLAKSATPGNKSVYVNWDAINGLPDEFEVVVSKIMIDMNKDFSQIGKTGSYMPKPELMYQIAEAAGISGGDKSIQEPMIEEIDINPMLCKSIAESPTYRKMTVGYKVSKYSTRLQEDGTLLKSGVCTIGYHVWNRCIELWDKEEMYSEGYTKKGKYDFKYDTMYKRKAHFSSEMKFAHAKAETKAHLKTIRELAGLMTGYRLQDLSSGYLIFSKVRRSKEVLKAETAARLAAISAGGEVKKDNPLFAPENVIPQIEETVVTPEPTPEPKPEPDPTPEPTPEPDQEPISMREMMIKTFKTYQKSGIIHDKDKATAEKIVSWLEKTRDAENSDLWDRALGILKQIEQSIPEDGKIVHNLY